MTKVRIFGVIHVDSPEITESELRDFCVTRIEAIFIEDGEIETTLREVLKILLLFPAVFIGAMVQGLASEILRIGFNKDWQRPEVIAAEAIAEDRDLPLYKVDIDPWMRISQLKYRHVATNWTVILISLFLFYVAYYAFCNGLYLQAAGWTVAAFCLPMFPMGWFIHTTMSERDHHMLKQVQQISEKYDYLNVCLVVGREHAKNMPDLLPQYRLKLEDQHNRKMYRSSESD